MHFRKRIIFLLTALIYSSAGISCKSTQQQVLFENRNTADTLVRTNLPTKHYLISPQDLLQVKNLQNRKLIVNDPIENVADTPVGSDGQTYLVEADSTIALPMLGRVKVAGLTRAEAANHIEMLYRKELKDPIIELKIINLRVTLLGEVKNQGVYMLNKEQTPLAEIIGEAGGFTEKASSNNVKIIRGNMQSPQVFELDLTNINTLSDPRIMLQNNDIIYITQHKKAIRSQKLQSMSAILQPVVILLNTVLIIYTLTR